MMGLLRLDEYRTSYFILVLYSTVLVQSVRICYYLLIRVLYSTWVCYVQRFHDAGMQALSVGGDSCLNSYVMDAVWWARESMHVVKEMRLSRSISTARLIHISWRRTQDIPDAAQR